MFSWKEQTMKTQILCAIAAVALATGCAETRKDMGAAKENDQNVLTGGPMTGTKVKDLPEPVRNALKDRAPTSEIADIDKETRDGQVVYKVTFAEPGKNPALYITADGNVLQKGQDSFKSDTLNK